MKDKIKKIAKLFFIFLIVCVPFFCATIVNADSGWDSDYDSGGWDSGSDWDSGSSWDSDWDSGSDWDDDYSYSSSSSSDLDFGGVMIMIFIILIIVALSSKKGNNRRHMRGPSVIPSASQYSSTNSQTSSYSDISNDEVKAILPDENLITLKNMAYKSFVDVQNAWSNFEYDKLRELCTDELYNSYVSQLETLKLKNGQNIMSDFAKMDTKIISLKEENGEIVLTVYLYVQFYDYVINSTSGEVTRGNSNIKLSNKYIMTFVKGADSKGNDDKCPSCGAPIDFNTSGECEYCHSTIVKKATKFVLSKKTNVNK